MRKILVFFFALCASQFAMAQVPKTLSFQGYLIDKATGNPVGGSSDATLNMEFSLYDADAGGALIWGPELHNGVIISKGLYRVILGKGSPAKPLDLSGDLDFTKTYYLQVIVGGEPFDKRIEVTSSAYSLSSGNASNITIGMLPIARGGTNATTAADARTSLGVVIGTNVQAYDADLTTYAGITPSANIQTLLGSADNAAARTNLGVAIGTNVQAYDADLDDLADGSLSGSKVGAGINAANVTTGTLPEAQVPGLDAGKIITGTFGTGFIADDAITAAKLQDDASTDANRAVTTNHIRDLAVTNAKLAADINTSKITAGTLPIARGGTNFTATPTNGGVAYGTGTAFAFTTAGTAGQLLQSNGAASPTWVNAPALSWTLTGTAGTVDGTNFIGTTDNVPLNFRVSNQKAGRIASNGPVFLGYQAGNVNTSTTNMGLGYQSLLSNTIGNNNTAIGYSTLSSNIANSGSTAIGFSAMEYANNATSGLMTFNVAVGYQALQGSTTPSANTGKYNTGIGALTLKSNTTGENNTALGSGSLSQNTSGQSNTGLGSGTLANNQTGSYNTAVGQGTLIINTGSGNTGTGSQALYANTTGNENTAYGGNALSTNVTGSNNTAIGYGADVSTSNLTNATAIGAYAMVGSSNSLVLGNNANVGIGTSVPSYPLHVTGSAPRTAVFTNGMTVPAGGIAYGVYSEATGAGSTASSIKYGIKGDATGGLASNTGVAGYADGGTITNFGLFGQAIGSGTASNYGVRGIAQGSGAVNYGVYGSASGGAENWAGVFDGNVGVGINLNVGGFTKLGSDGPAIKYKKLTGTTGANEGDEVAVSHGLTASKILSVSVIVEATATFQIHPGYTLNAEYLYNWYLTGTQIRIWNHSSSSENIRSKPFRILITYEE